MSRDKPKLSLGSAGSDQEGSSLYDPKQIEEASERNRVPFSTILDAGLYEKLKAASFFDRIKIADIVNDAVREKVQALEDRRGEAYSVPEPLRIED
jgi:hypothetical protein